MVLARGRQEGVRVLEPYQGNYFLARAIREGGLQDVRCAGAVLYQKENEVLFRLVNSLVLSTMRLMLVRYILFTGEEQGVVGSMVGYSDDPQEDLDVVSDDQSVWLLDSALSCLNSYVGSYPVNSSTSGIGPSDLSAFWNVGKPAILFIEDEHLPNPYYHTYGDTVGGALVLKSGEPVPVEVYLASGRLVARFLNKNGGAEAPPGSLGEVALI